MFGAVRLIFAVFLPEGGVQLGVVQLLEALLDVEDAVHVAVDDLAADLGLEPEAEDEHQEDAQRHAQDDDAPEQDGHDGGRQRMGQEGDHAVQAVLQRLVEGLVQQDHLRPHVGQSIGATPCSSKNAFACEKCLHPKKPRYAESGLG